MASFDIVSRLEIQDIDNAINVVNKKIAQRYDFKGLHILVELNKKDKTLKVEAPEEKFRALQEIIVDAFLDQKVSPKTIEWGKKDDAHMGAVRMNCRLREGIEKELAKKINKQIKDMKLKVKSQVQSDQLRVEAKSIDELQAVIAEIKAADYETPLQFINMKR